MYQSAAMIARRWFEEVWNDNRDAAIDELMHPQAVFHMEGSEVRTPGEFRQMRDAFMSAFPGLRIEIEDVVSNGEHAVVRWHFHGAHNGSGFGERATGGSMNPSSGGLMKSSAELMASSGAVMRSSEGDGS